MRFEVIVRSHPLRAVAEALVTESFQREYGACIDQFPELMIAALDGAGEPQCVAGLRDSETGFFSEQYLDQPIEQAIAAAAGCPVERTEVLELGSVAARRPGGLIMMLQGFADFGIGGGYRWGIFTTTGRLRSLARRLGVGTVDLGPARADRVADAGRWGSYYDGDPHVCAVEGIGARTRLQQAGLPCGANAIAVPTR